jgi:hypothetical protein
MAWAAGRGRFLSALLMLGCLAGCKGLFGSQGLPDDPLFLDKKPLESRAESGPPVALSYSEPAPPSNPYFAKDRAGAIAVK